MTAMPGDLDVTAVPLAAVHARMRRAVTPGDSAAPLLYAWLRDHLGWPDGGADLRAESAKGIRPRLALVAWSAVGGPADHPAAIDIAAAVELTHEFSLVHDDIEDGDTVRRGRPTLWRQVGVAQALNAGDALFALAREVLMAAPLTAETRLALAAIYDRACVRLAEGQALDLAFEAAPPAAVSVDDHRAMIDGKTGALLGASVELGARGAGADAATAAALGAWGRHVGAAFQLQDDILGLWGDPQRTGKPVGHDLVRRKKSLAVLLAARDPRLAERVAAVLAAEPVDAAAAAGLADAMAAAGVADACRRVAQGLVEAAAAALDGVPIDDRSRRGLTAFGRQAVARDR